MFGLFKRMWRRMSNKNVIKELTPEQDAYLPVMHNEYLDAACGGHRANRERLEQAIADIYAEINEPAPRVIIMSNPLRMLAATVIYESNSDHPEPRGWDQAEWNAQVSKALERPTFTLKKQIKNALFEQRLYGSQDLFWVAWGKYAEYIGVEFDSMTSRNLDIMKRIGFECEWWVPFNHVCFVSERPLEVHWDDRQRLHREDGPALVYEDNFCVCSWHGTTIPNEWVMEPGALTPEIAMKWENVEERRCACEILGWDAILQRLNAKLIDRDPSPLIGELYEVNSDVTEGLARFLRVNCPTGRTFALPVDTSCRTAREANASTWEMSADEYHPEVET